MLSKKIFSSVLLCLSVLMYGVSSYSASIFVAKVKGSGVDKSSKETVQELVRTAVTEQEGFSLGKSGADFTLKAKLLKLGNSYILKIDKVKGSKVVFSSKLKATSLSDIDVVTGRVVRSVLTEVKTDRAATITDVTEDEQTRGTRRYEATRQWRIAFGSAWSHGLNVSAGGTTFGLGYVWGLDPDYDLKLNWFYYSPRNSDSIDAGFTNLSLGMNYFFNRKKTSPFVTASLGYASATADVENPSWGFSDDDASGWALTAGGGVKFFRTSTVNVGVVAEYTFLLDKTALSNKTPGVTTLSLVVYY